MDVRFYELVRSVMGVRCELVFACLLLGCGGGSVGGTQISAIPLIDGDPFVSRVEYEIRNDEAGLVESGDMVGIPITDRGVGSYVWELVTTLRSGDHEIALSAYGAGFVCGGTGAFLVPSGGVSEFGIVVDCRTQPNRPPGGDAGGLYIIGELASLPPE
jgi:hypothetical protein